MESLNANSVLTLLQALQLVGLIPSLFVIFFLSTLVWRNDQAIVPILYFVALSAGFLIPLSELYPDMDESWAHSVLLFGESLLVAFSFLLVIQFLLNSFPPLFYWLVLAIPLIGGTLIIYAGTNVTAPCLNGHNCIDPASYKTLYNILSSSLIFLLLIYYSSRFANALKADANRKHKYWLIVALILLNLFVLVVDLARLAEKMDVREADFIVSVLRLSFIYLVITSLFRVFYPTLAGQVIHAAEPPSANNPEVDQPHVEKIRTLLEVDRVYREMRLNRAAFAEKVGIGEHTLSRIINHYFGKSVSELINSYRIEEAKLRLRDEPDTQITVIGFEVGFNSIASFNRVFKEKAGVSPTEWRLSFNSR